MTGQGRWYRKLKESKEVVDEEENGYSRLLNVQEELLRYTSSGKKTKFSVAKY